MSTAPATISKRSDVDPADTWDLSGLYADDDAWFVRLPEVAAKLEELDHHRLTLGESAEALGAFLDAQEETRRVLHHLLQYARRRADVDLTNDHTQGMKSRAEQLVDRFSEIIAFYRPALFAVPDDTLAEWLQHEALEPWKLAIERVLRDKPYALSADEERLMALTGELQRAPSAIFRKIQTGDVDFEPIVAPDGTRLPVTYGRYYALMTDPERAVRRDGFHAFYDGFAAHRYALAQTLVSGMKVNIFEARARRFPSARAAALHPDAVPAKVYDNLISTVKANLGPVHQYYDLVKERLDLADGAHFYDIMAPLVSEEGLGRSYDQAVTLVSDAVSPLGEDYARTLRNGLGGGWVDRYENIGKVPGAYSSGCYDSNPFILMNYDSSSIEHVYTLAHEGGHSMHSWYARKTQPPQYAAYRIFVAEVASTFNELLLTRHLLDGETDPRLRAAIIARELDGLRGLIYRQVQFADFEHQVHQRLESGRPMGLDDLTALYRDLLECYLGPVVIDDALELECLRVPHFYYGFYVYKYATGVAAALSLFERVIAEEPGALERYLAFLASGGRQDPIDALRSAGVDMASPEPVERALAYYADRLDQLVTMLDNGEE